MHMIKDQCGNTIDVGDMIHVGHDANQYQVIAITDDAVTIHCVSRDYQFDCPTDGFGLWHWLKVDAEPQWQRERQLHAQRIAIMNGKGPIIGGVDDSGLEPLTVSEEQGDSMLNIYDIDDVDGLALEDCFTKHVDTFENHLVQSTFGVTGRDDPRLN